MWVIAIESFRRWLDKLFGYFIITDNFKLLREAVNSLKPADAFV
jgi:hypothetical protein